jgi:hypothetical protein
VGRPIESEIKALIPQQVEIAMKRYIPPTQLVIVGAGDFSKAGN